MWCGQAMRVHIGTVARTHPVESRVLSGFHWMRLCPPSICSALCRPSTPTRCVFVLQYGEALPGRRSPDTDEVPQLMIARYNMM